MAAVMLRAVIIAAALVIEARCLGGAIGRFSPRGCVPSSSAAHPG